MLLKQDVIGRYPDLENVPTSIECFYRKQSFHFTETTTTTTTTTNNNAGKIFCLVNFVYFDSSQVILNQEIILIFDGFAFILGHFFGTFSWT